MERGEMKRVNIILSTYNGQRYLSTQLDSIFNQTYSNIVLYVRDDGSTDSTVTILEEYQNKYGSDKLKIIYDDLGNLGYVKSFLNIIRNTSEAEYYAFCDQDDYWLPNKIERAVQHLEMVEKDKCALYTGAYSVCDGDLNVIDSWHRPTEAKKLNVGKTLSLYDGGWLLGFTCVFNKCLKELAFDNQAVEMYSHDIWVQTVDVAFNGNLLIDSEVTSYFRRHNNTTSIAEQGVEKSVWDSWKYRWDEMFGNGELFGRLKDSMVSFQNVFGNKLDSPEDNKFLSLFGTKEKDIKTRIKKIFYPHRLKKSFLVEIAWRVAILMGKI